MLLEFIEAQRFTSTQLQFQEKVILSMHLIKEKILMYATKIHEMVIKLIPLFT